MTTLNVHASRHARERAQARMLKHFVRAHARMQTHTLRAHVRMHTYPHATFVNVRTTHTQDVANSDARARRATSARVASASQTRGAAPTQSAPTAPFAQTVCSAFTPSISLSLLAWIPSPRGNVDQAFLSPSPSFLSRLRSTWYSPADTRV